MGGMPIQKRVDKGIPVLSNQIGYIKYINVDSLQDFAETADVIISLNGMPGTFASPDKPILSVIAQQGKSPNIDKEKLNKAFVIDDSRSFYDDPRFGLIALSEIASRALSPGINDPGTAIAIIGSHVRLFVLWLEKGEKIYPQKIKYDRIEVPEIALDDIFYDAFRPIARDGAGNIEVMLRLQKAFTTIAFMGSNEVKEITLTHSLYAYQRAELAIENKRDLELLKAECPHTKN